MGSSPSGSPIDGIAYLARSEHRVPMLVALAIGPRSRSELCEMVGVSSSTIRRTLGEFEDRHWIRRNGYRYEATPLGAFVSHAMSELIDRVETERKLRDVWQGLPGEESGFTIDMCADAVVTVAAAEDPYRPVNRFISLLRETERFRFVGLDIALLEPCKDELSKRIVDGMQTEIIDPPSAASYIRSTYPEHCSAPLESGNLAVSLHDDLPPFGICLFDRRIGVIAYNPDSGTVRALVDTDASSAREWAESTYLSYRREARPLPLEPLSKTSVQ